MIFIKNSLITLKNHTNVLIAELHTRYTLDKLFMELPQKDLQ